MEKKKKVLWKPCWNTGNKLVVEYLEYNFEVIKHSY